MLTARPCSRQRWPGTVEPVLDSPVALYGRNPQRSEADDAQPNSGDDTVRSAGSPRCRPVPTATGQSAPHGNGHDASIAFEEAARRVMPVLMRYAYRLTGQTTAAEDLVQTTMLRAWAAREQFQAGTNFRAWLLRIARNAFLTELRRTRREVAWNPDAHDKLMVAVATQDEALYQADFDRALNRLPPAQATAFLLIAREGVSYDDAAEHLRIERGALASRVSRARAQLRADCMAERRPPPPSIPAAKPEPPSKSEPLSECVPSRYERWKASGARLIG